MLPPTLINTDALKYQPFWESRLNRAYLKDWVYMKRGGTHWCKVFFHSTPYNVTPDNKITSDITLDKLWTVNDIVVNLFLLRMVYNGQKHSSGINVCIVVDIKIEYLGLWKRFVWGRLDVDGLVLKRPKAPSVIAFRGGEKTSRGLKLLSKICQLFGKFAKRHFCPPKSEIQAMF